MTWTKITYERYWDALEALPPALMTGSGFLLGEPHDHRTCKVTGDLFQPTFSAFVSKGSKWDEGSEFYEHEPLTIAEFRDALRKGAPS